MTEKRKVLVVDDTAHILKLTHDIFALAGFDVKTAGDGAEALGILQHEPMDLVVTDILMPAVDGYLLCYTIRTTEHIRNIPVIIYSATYTSSSDESMALDIGADRFIRKPATMKTLIETANDLLAAGVLDHKIPTKPKSIEANRLYSEGLVRKLEHRNDELEAIRINLEQERALLREAQKIAHIGSWKIDFSTGEHVWSAEFWDLLGISEAGAEPGVELFLSLVHPEDIERVKGIVNQTLGLFLNTEFELRFVRKDGDVRTAFIKSRVEFNQAQQPVAVFGFLQDITERRRIEEERIFDQSNMLALVNNTDDLIWSVDTSMKLITCNRAFEEFASQKGGITIGKGNLIALDPFSTHSFQVYYERAFSGESFTETLSTADAEPRWMEMSFYPILQQNAVVGTACFSRDITVQRQYENHLHLLESVVTNANDAVMITKAFPLDGDGPEIIFVNNAFLQMTKFLLDEVIGKTPRILQGPESSREELQKIKRALELNETIETELINYTRNREPFWNNFSIVPIRDGSGKVSHFVSIQRDTTLRKSQADITRKRLEKLVVERTAELKEALDKEKELAELKNRFVAIASHEFRTPLSTISLAAESIRNYFHQLSGEEIQRKLIKIEDQASHMTNLLEDILTIGKADAGKIKVKKISLDLKNFISSLIEETSSSVKTKRRIVFTYDHPDTMLNLDDKLMRNIINNLLTNAIKFSSEGSLITITVSGTKHVLMIEVKDEGIGIHETDLQSVFEPFQRGSNSSAVQGTGLGLSILKKAVELMDGSVTLKSKLNEGSSFLVTFPLE